MPYDFSQNIDILNLCDRSPKDITKYKKLIKNSNIVMQIGSYCCENYFKYISDNGKIIKDTEYDIVIPVFSEHFIKALDMEKFAYMCKNARNVVVNDIGMLNRLKDRDIDIRLGRLFFKEYDNSHYEGKAPALIDFMFKHGICVGSVENDIATRNYIVDLPQDIKIYFHFPYRQISICRMCEFASVGKALEYKFIPDDKCTMQCLYTKIYNEGSGYLKIGKSIYDILNLSYLKDDWHIIYTPEWSYENNGSHCR